MDWTGPIEGYSKNYISRQLYKLEPLGYEFCDLINEAYLVYDKCKRKYGDTDSPKHFMALFKTALNRHFFDLWYPRREEPFKRLEVENIESISPFGDIEEEGIFQILLGEAPREIKEVLSHIFNAPDEVLDLIGFHDRRRGRSLVSCNKKLCALLGYDHKKTNLMVLVKTYFSV
jgi:hypothetical protein